MPQKARVLGWSLFLPLFIGAALLGALGFAIGKGHPAVAWLWGSAAVLGLVAVFVLLRWSRGHVPGRYQ